jgi:CRP-like cAMP-binding protein
VIGEMALIGDRRRTASAIARTNCRLAPINERRFLFLVQETPFFALHIMRVLAERILRKDSASS